MSKEKTSKMSKQDTTDLIIGIVAVFAIVALFAFVFLTIQANRANGEISYFGETRRGSEQVFTYKPGKEVKQGQIVSWYVDGRCVKTTTYNGRPIVLNYTPDKTGETSVKVVAGKLRKSTMVEVKKPILTLKATDYEITYGDVMPQLRYEYSGMLEGDTPENVGLHVSVKTEGCNTCCGISPIKVCVNCEDCRYEVKCVDGFLTVRPKELHIVNTFEKQYDQTKVLPNPVIVLDGLLEGDQVSAVASELYFEEKDVGVQNIVTANIQLQGKDSANYFLCNEPICGTITPKPLVLEGLTVANKYYDGTTSAKITGLGNLTGVCDGDSVAIGSMDVRFGQATVGNQQIVVTNIVLVGLDKDNYYISDIVVENADILAVATNK